MSQISLIVKYQKFSAVSELPADEQQLLALAKAALSLSYAPYSNFKVGAAIQLSNGETLKGSNQENAAYPLCLCAERVVLAAASSVYPNIAVTTMAITAKSLNKIISQPISPCGACRQVICEVEQRNHTSIKIIVQGEVGDIYVFESVRDLLPFFFDNTFL